MKDGEIKHKLSPAQVSVMLHRVTEPPYFGKFWDHFEDGTYRCAACDTALFASGEKFDSKTGWPSFKKPINERDLQFKSEAGPDDKVEIRCKKCKGHLGYVISGDNPYYRINSVCLLFEKREVPAVVAPPADEPQKKGKKIETIPAPVPLIIEPMNDGLANQGWTTGSLIAASIIALLVGAGVTYLYMTYTPLPSAADTATSTPLAATSTPDTSETDEPEATQSEETPEETPEETLPENPAPQTDATSTQ